MLTVQSDVASAMPATPSQRMSNQIQDNIQPKIQQPAIEDKVGAAHRHQKTIEDPTADEERNLQSVHDQNRRNRSGILRPKRAMLEGQTNENVRPENEPSCDQRCDTCRRPCPDAQCPSASIPIPSCDHLREEWRDRGRDCTTKKRQSDADESAGIRQRRNASSGQHRRHGLIDKKSARCDQSAQEHRPVLAQQLRV